MTVSLRKNKKQEGWGRELVEKDGGRGEGRGGQEEVRRCESPFNLHYRFYIS